MIRALTFAALCFAAFLPIPSFEVRAGEEMDTAAITDHQLSVALNGALRGRRCEEAARLIKQSETRRLMRRPIRFIQGIMYEFGICAPQDWTLAAATYRSASILGSDTSRLRLGGLYLNGLGVAQDRGKAREWFRRLMYAMLDVADEERMAWLQKWWGEEELPEVLLDELAWLRRVEGDPRSRMRVAVRIMTGDGLPRDVKAAEKWLRSAVSPDLPEAKLKLAQWLMDGEIEEFYEREGAWKLFRVASAGYLPAMVDLATRHLEGDGVRKSDIHAYPWLLRAKWAGAPVDELLAAVGARLTNFDRKLAERDAKDAKYLPIAFN